MENSQLQFHMQMATGSEIRPKKEKEKYKKNGKWLAVGGNALASNGGRNRSREWVAFVGRLFFLINEVKMFSANKFMRRAASKL